MSNSPALDLPPAAEAAQRALSRLEPLDTTRAALHLLTPRSVLVGVHVHLDNGWAHWREGSGYVESGGWAEVISSCRALVMSAQRDGDEFLDLDAEPGSWLKLVRSGAYIHLAGARELFGAQAVTFDPALSPAVARTVAAMISTGQTLVAGVLHLGGSQVRVRANNTAAHLAPQ